MNQDVTELLDNLNHPLRKQIEEVRKIILGSSEDIEETIKWNGPNYSVNNNDRVTVRVQPGKTFQIIFHTGAKTKAAPVQRLISDDDKLLSWKSNDRAILDLKDEQKFQTAKPHLKRLIKDWLLSSL